MNTKKSIILPQLVIAALVCLVVPQRSTAALSLTNGDFQDLTGLTPQPGSPGWYQGVPAGWSSSTANLNFNVIDYSSGNIGANLQTLGPSSLTPLYQSVGLLPSTGDVTLSFNILGLNANAYVMDAAIYDASSGTGPNDGWVSLFSGSYDRTVGSFQTLVAPNVAANTTIGVGFWQSTGSPGIDNVTVVPEPSTYMLLVLAAGGLAAHVVRRRRLR